MLSIQDAVENALLQIRDNDDRRTGPNQISFLIYYAECCIVLDALELALSCLDRAFAQVGLALVHKDEMATSLCFEICDLYASISDRLLDGCCELGDLRHFLGTSIDVLRSPPMANHTGAEVALAGIAGEHGNFFNYLAISFLVELVCRDLRV